MALENTKQQAVESAAKNAVLADSLQQVNRMLRDSIAYLDSTMKLAHTRPGEGKTNPVFPKKSSMSKDDEYTKKALFIFNFTKYVAWPAESVKGDKFVIGIVGESYLVEKIKEQTKGKKAFGKPIEIKVMTVTEISDCQMVFIPHSSIGNLRSIKEKLKKNTLIVTEEGQGAYYYSHLNLYPDDNRVRYSVNKTLLEKQDLKATQDLIRYAD